MTVLPPFFNGFLTSYAHRNLILKMTTVCLKSKSSIKTEARSTAFKSFNTDAQSCLFIKQLTSTCISTILFLRKVLPAEFFETKSFEGLSLRLLKSRPGDSNVIKIQQWLEGAFDAIEKKYLKRLMLDIQDAESNKILEVYTMTFSYCNEKDPLNSLVSTTSSFNDKFSVSNTKMNTVKLLQMCYAVTQAYNNLPTKVNLDIRLSYYKNTPDEYQPKGYVAWNRPDPDFSDQARSIEIGTTRTPHHFFKLFNKSSLNDRFLKNMEAQTTVSASTALPEGDDTQGNENTSQLRQTKAKRELCFNTTYENSKTALSVPLKSEAETSLHGVSERDVLTYRERHTRKTKLLKDFNTQTIRCSCLLSKKSESMFSCSNCGFLVHAECFGILQFDSSKKIRFFCHLCHQKENAFRCHDKIMVNLKNSSDQQKLSLLRRILKHCNMPSVDKITLRKMEKIVGLDCQNNIMNIILKKMIEIGVAIPQRKKKSYLIDKNKLANKLMIYFYKVLNPNQNADQILPYSLRSSTFKGKDEKAKLFVNKKNKCSPILKEEPGHHDQTVSQLSFDIFS